MLAYRKIMRLAIFTALPTLLTAVWASAALAQVSSGSFPGTVNPTFAPASSHLTSGTIGCVVSPNLDVTCSSYVLGGVGHTNATVDLTADYSATIDCTNNGGNLVETHTTTTSASSSASVPSTKNGQLSVPAQMVANPILSAPQTCPNPNWTPSIRGGSATLNCFTYALTFQGFGSPAVDIASGSPQPCLPSS